MPASIAARINVSLAMIPPLSLDGQVGNPSVASPLQ
jgi:hypothetical protein